MITSSLKLLLLMDRSHSMLAPPALSTCRSETQKTLRARLVMLLVLLLMVLSAERMLWLLLLLMVLVLLSAQPSSSRCCMCCQRFGSGCGLLMLLLDTAALLLWDVLYSDWSMLLAKWRLPNEIAAAGAVGGWHIAASICS